MTPKKTNANPEQQKKAKNTVLPLAHAVGRRKCAAARVWVRRGSGKILVNGLDYTAYFDTDFMRGVLMLPFRAVPHCSNYDFQVTVEGGGKVGQAHAVKLGMSRAILTIDEALRANLRQFRLLTVDSRKKERKKYGQRGARRKFQFVKR